MEPGQRLKVTFDEGFVTRDQDVADLANPRPETRFCLMELPKEELEAIQAGQVFRFQAHRAGGVALCTSKKTWAMEFLENSNSMFLGFPKAKTPAKQTKKKDEASQATGATAAKGDALDSAELECKLFGQVRGQFFLKPINCDASRLGDLVGQHKLSLHPEDEDEKNIERPPVTMSALQYEVAASEAEIQSSLADGPYVEQNGAWKIIPIQFRHEVLDVALAEVTANGWDKSAVDGSKLLSALHDNLGAEGKLAIPNLQVLRKIMDCVIATNKDVKPETLCLDGDKVHKFQAVQLLSSSPAAVRKRFDLPLPEAKKKRARVTGATASTSRDPGLALDEFAHAFRAVSGLETSGEEIIKVLGEQVHFDELEGTVHLLNVAALPQDGKLRLKRLFEIQSHWRPEKLAALIAPTLGGQKVDAWLMKWARTVFVTIEGHKDEQRMMMRKFAGI